MRPTAAAVAEALTTVERAANSAGWAGLPVLYALVEPPSEHGAVSAVPVSLDASFWRENQLAIDSGFMPIWAVLSVIVDRLLLDESWSPLEDGSQTLGGMAFGRESWDTSALDDHPGAVPVRVRVLTGYDRYGRTYRIARVSGAEPTVTVHASGPPPDADLIDECLRRLVAAHCADAPAVPGGSISPWWPEAGES